MDVMIFATNSTYKYKIKKFCDLLKTVLFYDYCVLQNLPTHIVLSNKYINSLSV